MTYAAKRDLLVSARIPSRLRERVERALRTVQNERGDRYPESFNTAVNQALEQWCDRVEINPVSTALDLVI